ncbi:MAG TPA: hypothetical protein VHX11_02615 [Acidobacteriaceae bacterium]|nr:hypothetical protein [Acidobacteriaceae bacterium]
MRSLIRTCRRAFGRPMSLAMVLAALSTWSILPAASAQEYSSSNDFHQAVENLVQDQYPNQGGYGGSRPGGYHEETSALQHIAIEAGGGFNRPLGGTRGFATWGGNFMVGAGWNFTKQFATLAEWSILDDKIPGGYLSNVGAPGGHIHTWGLTLEPTYYYKTSGTIGGYVIGGGGFYRRVTTFTVPEEEEECYYFCYDEVVNVPFAHYSSNQGGLNFGTGVTWKAFGPDSNTKIFGEVRYVWVNSPKTNVFGTPDGTESFLPVSAGLRW